MPRVLNRLAVKAVETVKKPGSYPDGGGLHLLVTESGSRRWELRYKTKAKSKGGNPLTRQMGLGVFPDVSLAQARALAAEARRVLASGGDPIEARRQERKKLEGTTFGQMAEEVFASKAAGFRNQKHKDVWIASVRNHCKPLWDTPVEKVSTQAVLQVLRPLWETRPETGVRVRGRIETIIDAARALGKIPPDQGNPARWKGHLALLLPPRSKLSRGHFRSMPYDDVPAFMASLRERHASSALALQWLVLSAARTSEVLGARWNEIDRDARTWAVPAGRTKTATEHVVPLTDAMLAILDEIEPLRSSPDDPLFPGVAKPGQPAQPLSSMSLLMLLRAMGASCTSHGFRASFRTWAAEQTSVEREIAELSLAHRVGSAVERSYQRSTLLQKRRALMEMWADHCLGRTSGATVIPMKRASGD